MEDQNVTPNGVGLQEITSVKWTDDNGTQYRRTIEDGEIIDRKISND